MFLRHVACVAIALSLFAPAAARAKCAVQPILAMTYNVRLDTPADGSNAWIHRRHMLIGQVATLRPELLGLQEVLLNQKHDLEAAFPGYRFVGGGRDDGRDAGEFSPLAIDTATFRIGGSGMFWLSPTPAVPSLAWGAGYKRVATWARLVRRSDGARLLVVNTHWDHQSQTARREGGTLILDWLGRNRRRGEHLMLLGDFNAEVSEDSVAQLTRGTLGLRDTRSLAAQGIFGPALSFNGFNPFPSEGKLIDHILVGSGIAVRSHGVHALHENGRVASDHFPVVALIDLPPLRRGRSCGDTN